MKVEITGYDEKEDQLVLLIDGAEKRIYEDDAFTYYHCVFGVPQPERKMTVEQFAIARLYDKSVESGHDQVSQMIGLAIEVDEDGIPV